MWGLESLGIPYNVADGTITLPGWVAVAAAGFGLVLLVLALTRTRLGNMLVFLALIGFGGWAVYSSMEFERATERRTLEARLSMLQAQTAAPGSAFACLDGVSGATIEGACERDVFSSPEAAAAAVSYTVARLVLLADGLNFTARRDPTFDSVLDGLRTALEQDRFGFVAHVLVQRNRCSVDLCEDFRLFRDPNRIRVNIQQGTFEGNLARATPSWNAPPAAPRTAGADAPPMRATPLPPGYNLPSADSIPPVSIMNTEPAAPAAAADSQGTTPLPPPPPRRPPTSQARPPQQQPANTGTQQRLPPPPMRLQ